MRSWRESIRFRQRGSTSQASSVSRRWESGADGFMGLSLNCPRLAGSFQCRKTGNGQRMRILTNRGIGAFWCAARAGEWSALARELKTARDIRTAFLRVCTGRARPSAVLSKGTSLLRRSFRGHHSRSSLHLAFLPASGDRTKDARGCDALSCGECAAGAERRVWRLCRTMR